MSSIYWLMPVIQALPEIIGMMAGRDPIGVERSMRQTNSNPMSSGRAIDVALSSARVLLKSPCERYSQSRSVSGRSCGADDDGVRTPEFVSLARERPGELTEGDMVPAAGLGMGEAELLIRGGDDANAGFR